MSTSNVLYIVVPCYNEYEVINYSENVISKKIKSLIDSNIISEKSKILFVDDGSNDETWSLISLLCDKNSIIAGIKLSRNRGHQNALLAGLMYAKDKADITISMDADLQDDVNSIDEMIKKYNDGCDIVYGVRSSRDKDSWFKRTTSQTYYKLLCKLGVEIIYNHADFRLMSKKALEALSQFKEKNLFLRGIVPLIGFKTDKVYYERQERKAGSSKYGLNSMLSLAFEGITSFSVKPIRMIFTFGLLIFLVSIIILIISVVKWYNGVTVAGWASIMCSIWAIGGILMLSIGVIGEYIGKIYLETKQRPSYFIDKIIDD